MSKGMEEIEEMERTLSGEKLNPAKERLAYELTQMVHGKEEADKALAAARAVFSAGSDTENMPVSEIPAAEVEGEIGLLTLLVKAGIAPSNGEARRLVQQGGISIDGEKMTDPTAMIAVREGMVIKKGKKVFRKVVLV